MLIAGLFLSAALGWAFGYLHATQSIQTSVNRFYNVKLRIVK